MMTNVTVRVVPVSGNPVDHPVQIPEGGTVADALKAAGVQKEKTNITIERPGSPAEQLKQKDVVVVQLPQGATVTLTQKPAGS